MVVAAGKALIISVFQIGQLGRSGVAPRRKDWRAFPFRGLKPHGYRHKVAPRQIPNRPLATEMVVAAGKALIISVCQLEQKLI
jgi:hypothetical protein